MPVTVKPKGYYKNLKKPVKWHLLVKKFYVLGDDDSVAEFDTPEEAQKYHAEMSDKNLYVDYEILAGVAPNVQRY